VCTPAPPARPALPLCPLVPADTAPPAPGPVLLAPPPAPPPGAAAAMTAPRRNCESPPPVPFVPHGAPNVQLLLAPGVPPAPTTTSYRARGGTETSIST